MKRSCSGASFPSIIHFERFFVSLFFEHASGVWLGKQSRPVDVKLDPYHGSAFYFGAFFVSSLDALMSTTGVHILKVWKAFVCYHEIVPVGKHLAIVIVRILVPAVADLDFGKAAQNMVDKIQSGRGPRKT